MSALSIATDGYLDSALSIATDGYMTAALLVTQPGAPSAQPRYPLGVARGAPGATSPGLPALDDLVRVMAAQIGIALQDGDDADRLCVSIGLVLDAGEPI